MHDNIILITIIWSCKTHRRALSAVSAVCADDKRNKNYCSAVDIIKSQSVDFLFHMTDCLLSVVVLLGAAQAQFSRSNFLFCFIIGSEI